MVNISIIIPVYNVSGYIKKCLDSITVQLPYIYEIILVDDGSTDGSSLICDDYVKRFDKIRVIHKKNEGVSVARNVGIDCASGEWLAFVDSDDYLDSNWATTLQEILSLGKTYDIIGWGYNRVSNEDILERNVPFCNYYTNLERFIYSIDYNHAVWSFLFSKKIVDNYKIKFPSGIKYSEDQHFILEYLSHCNKVKLINNAFYNYVIRNDSAVASSFFLYKYKDNLKVIDGLLLKNNASAKLGANYMLRYYLQYAWKAKDYNKEEFYQDYKNVIINLRKFNISTGYISYRRFVYAFPSIHYKTAKYYKKFLRQRLRWTTYLQVIINIFYRY